MTTQLKKMEAKLKNNANAPQDTKVLLAQRLHTQDRMEIMTAQVEKLEAKLKDNAPPETKVLLAQRLHT